MNSKLIHTCTECS